MNEKNPNDLLQILQSAKEGAFEFSAVTQFQKQAVLREMADMVVADKKFILSENQKDIAQAEAQGKQKNFIERLTLSSGRIDEMANSLRAISEQKDPIGEVIGAWQRPNGLAIRKVRVAIGVILIIYEARPNVTSDCVGLCLWSSNVCILRGGSDAIHSNGAIFSLLKKAAQRHGFGKYLFFIEDTSHQAVEYILREAKNYIDLVIPRGGESLIKAVVELSTAPVIKHYKGVCHIYVDRSADLQKALAISVNAKVQRPSVCNAVEKILVHKECAPLFLPLLYKEYSRYHVQMRGCQRSREILPDIQPAHEEDWSAEYLDLIIAFRVVENTDEAIAHINHYGSAHTDSIITEDPAEADTFTQKVASACVFVNTSTRFSDGGEFGLGAEIGISTDKIHARGPMGSYELTTYKYIVSSDGKIRV